MVKKLEHLVRVLLAPTAGTVALPYGTEADGKEPGAVVTGGSSLLEATGVVFSAGTEADGTSAGDEPDGDEPPSVTVTVTAGAVTVTVLTGAQGAEPEPEPDGTTLMPPVGV
jgi:hypothetical protein